MKKRILSKSSNEGMDSCIYLLPDNRFVLYPDWLDIINVICKNLDAKIVGRYKKTYLNLQYNEDLAVVQSYFSFELSKKESWNRKLW